MATFLPRSCWRGRRAFVYSERNTEIIIFVIFHPSSPPEYEPLSTSVPAGAKIRATPNWFSSVMQNRNKDTRRETSQTHLEESAGVMRISNPTWQEARKGCCPESTCVSPRCEALIWPNWQPSKTNCTPWPRNTRYLLYSSCLMHSRPQWSLLPPLQCPPMQLFSPLTPLFLSNSFIAAATAATGDGTISDLVGRLFERRALSRSTAGPVGNSHMWRWWCFQAPPRWSTMTLHADMFSAANRMLAHWDSHPVCEKEYFFNSCPAVALFDFTWVKKKKKNVRGVFSSP